MRFRVLKDIVEWDQVNWSRAIRYWQRQNLPLKGAKVLDIGARNGGLSLFFALEGGEVLCTDLNGPTPKARALHEKYGVADRVRYESVDATDIPYTEAFDIVCFKSVLGGVGRALGADGQAKAIQQMYAALKPGGYLVFAENLSASWLHRLCRRLFMKWGTSWFYYTLDGILSMLSPFGAEAEAVACRTIGFFGAFGRKSWLCNALGRLDIAADWVFPARSRYIGAFVARKPG